MSTFKPFLIIICSLVCGICSSQNCITNTTNSLFFTSQQNLDDFAINYPNCDVINKNVRIFGDDITDLTSLGNIIHIEGFLNIKDCPNLRNLSGLESLVQVDDSVIIDSNENLNDISALNSLAFVSGITLRDLPSLLQVEIFSSLDSIKGNLIISELNTLSALAFPVLEYVDGFSMSETNSISIVGFPSLTTVRDDLDIKNNFLLTDMSGFDSLQTIGGNLNIDNNPLLNKLTSFSQLLSIGNFFQIRNCPVIDDIDFNALQRVEFVFRCQNSGLRNMGGFSSLQSVGALFIEKNLDLVNLEGLGSLLEVNGEIDISDNPHLVDISTVSNLDPTKIRYNVYDDIFRDLVLRIADNPLLDICNIGVCLLYTSPSPRDGLLSRMPSSA